MIETSCIALEEEVESNEIRYEIISNYANHFCFPNKHPYIIPYEITTILVVP